LILEIMPQHDSTGPMHHLKDGKRLAHQPHAGQQGPRITVNQLFYNTPARLKYLSSPQTELAAITDWVDHLAMSHPEVAFSLSNNGRTLLRTSGKDRKSTRLNSSHVSISYAVFCLKKKKKDKEI